MRETLMACVLAAACGANAAARPLAATREDVLAKGFTIDLTRLSTFETKARVLRGLSYAFLNYQIKVFTTPLRMPFAPLPS